MQETEKDYICSLAKDSGMHTCAVLPATKSDGRPCNDSVVPGIPVGLDGLSINGSCINWNQYYTDCRAGEKNPFQGAISFDNIGLAWVAIFLVSTHNFNFFFTFSTLYQYSMRCLCNSNLSNKLLSPIVPSKHIQHLISKTGNSCRRAPPSLFTQAIDKHHHHLCVMFVPLGCFTSLVSWNETKFLESSLMYCERILTVPRSV